MFDSFLEPGSLYQIHKSLQVFFRIFFIQQEKNKIRDYKQKKHECKVSSNIPNKACQAEINDCERDHLLLHLNEQLLGRVYTYDTL